MSCLYHHHDDHHSRRSTPHPSLPLDSVAHPARTLACSPSPVPPVRSTSRAQATTNSFVSINNENKAASFVSTNPTDSSSIQCSSFYSLVLNRLSLSSSSSLSFPSTSIKTKRCATRRHHHHHRDRDTSPSCDRFSNYNPVSRSSSTQSLIEHNISKHNRRFLDRLRRKKNLTREFYRHHQQLSADSVPDCPPIEEQSQESQDSNRPAIEETSSNTYCFGAPNPYHTYFHPFCGSRYYSPPSYQHHHHHHHHHRQANLLNSNCSLVADKSATITTTNESQRVSALISSPSFSTSSSFLEEDEASLHESNQFSCMATIMEILPLFLLLAMGVIISTTCAKYTFRGSESSRANRSRHGYGATHHGEGVSSGSYGHHHQEHLLSMMIHNDEEFASRSRSAAQAEDNGEGTRSSMSDMLRSGERLHQSARSEVYGKTQQQQRLMSQLDQVRRQYSVMRLRWLTNDSVTCNDGTRAGYYIRPSPGSKRWLIYLEGGWYCMSKTSCDQRWSKMREFMTSFRWSEFKTFNGILSSSQSSNPYWWDANHVFVPYCSSDIWSGDSAPQNEMAFMGSRIIDEVIQELIRSPVYHFSEAKLVMLAGSSAGAAGVMINLDRVAQSIADSGSKADVRGLADSGWILENDYLENKQYSKLMLPCTDPNNCSPMESIKNAFSMWNSRVPQACADRYPHEPWRCYFGHRLYPSLQTPLFVMQYQYDEFQVHIDGMNGRALNEYEKMQYIRSLSDKIRSTLANVSAVFAPSCMSHIMLTKLDWHKTSIRGVTLPEAINCWEHNPSASNHQHNPSASNHQHNRHAHPHHHPHEFEASGRNRVYHLLNSKHYYSALPSGGSTTFHKPNQAQQTSSGEGDELSQFYNTRHDFTSNTPTRESQARKARQSDDGQTIFRVNAARFYESGESRAEQRSRNVNQTLNDNNSITSLGNETSSTLTSVPSQANNHKANKKRRKRKRRKNHKHQHHQHNGTTSSGETSTTLVRRKKEEDNMPPRRHHHVTGGDELEAQDPSLNREQHQQQHDEPKCDYRLIDDHSFLKRNFECPRLYKSYME